MAYLSSFSTLSKALCLVYAFPDFISNGSTFPLYSMTKSAFTGFSKALALELAQDNITVNTINPGWVETELAQDAVEKSDFSYDEEIEMIPQKRFICPDEIANLVKYMVSDEAKGMTGQSVSLCAGLSAG